MKQFPPSTLVIDVRQFSNLKRSK